MNYNEYRKELDKIKASDELKQRIIDEVEGNDMKEKKLSNVSKILAGVTAVAGIAIVSTVLAKNGLRNNDDGQAVTMVESSTSSEETGVTKENETTEKNTSDVEIVTKNEGKHLSLMECENLVSISNHSEVNDEYTITVKNNGTENYKIYPEIWLTKVTDDVSKGYAIEEIPSEGIVKNDDVFLVKAGEEVTIDVSDDIKNYYSNIVNKSGCFYICFGVSREEEKEVTKMCAAEVTNPDLLAVYGVDKQFLEPEETEIKVFFINESARNFEGKVSCKLKKRNIDNYTFEEIGGVNWEKEINLPGMIGSENATKESEISLPSTLEAGEYLLSFTGIDNETGYVSESLVVFNVLNTKIDTGLVVSTNKEKYTSSEDIYLNIKSTNSKEWQDLEANLYVIKDGQYFDAGCHYIYHEEVFTEKNIDLKKELNETNEEFVMDAETRDLVPGEYALIVKMNDGKTKRVGVGEVFENEVILKTSFLVE